MCARPAAAVDRDRTGRGAGRARTAVAGLFDRLSSAQHGRAERRGAAPAAERGRARAERDAGVVGPLSARSCSTRRSMQRRSPPRCRGCSVDLVLTAHPTEAKRAIVLEHHRRLYLLLVKRENQMWTPYEQQAIREEIKTLLSLLWRTGEIFLQKPDVTAERRNIMHYLYRVFPEVLPILDRRLRQTWGDLGLDPGLLRRAGEPAAAALEHLGRRRSRRAPAGHRRRDTGHAERSAAARPAPAAASAGGAGPSVEPVGSGATAAAGDPGAGTAAHRADGRPRARGDAERAGRDVAAAGVPDAGAAAARDRLPRRGTAGARPGSISGRSTSCSTISGCCTGR